MISPVHAHAAGLDHAFRFAPRGDARARKNLGDPVAFRGFLSHAAALVSCAFARKRAREAMTFRSHMDLALEEARAAGRRGEVPVGAVVVAPDGTVVARAGNRTRELCDPTAHAEVLAIRAACAALGSERLVGHALYVTLEPCAICAGTIAAARIARVYYGASDPKSGGVAHGARVFLASPGASRARGV